MENLEDGSFEGRDTGVYDYIPKLIGGAFSGALTGVFALGKLLHFIYFFANFSDSIFCFLFFDCFGVKV